ncbi:PREDICTED: zinc finger protein 831-like [Thamnophis sirtalis]|uniref:Zinc finger protein 831-like n=1 Tax=Thamnophis sirtalis TaxID=35019 RepID=A0A6I9YMC1_9SAUR|nr:PREDICTED: zinc finger protein 831-like [Thamnophis sirtalis]
MDCFQSVIKSFVDVSAGLLVEEELYIWKIFAIGPNSVLDHLKEMEGQSLPCPPVSLEDPPVQLSCLQAIPAASDLLLGPMILQPEQALAQTVYLKALTIPFYQPVQSNHKLSRVQTNITIDNSNLPLILNPLLHSKGTDQLQAIIQKQPSTINMVSHFSLLPQSSSPGAPTGSPGKAKSSGKYLCKHCGRDCLKPSVLEKHMRSHTGERPFPCTTCGIAFKTQSNLYKHRRTQTHVNNARVPSESDSSSLLEENEKLTEIVTSSQTIESHDKNDVQPSTRTRSAASEPSDKYILATSLSETLLVSESQRVKTGNSCHGEINQNVFEKETARDATDLPQRKKIQDQRSPTGSRHSQLQRQQALYSEKLWNNRSVDIKLKKCESTDSGYLSRSDSVEHQTPSPGFLHSLCEHSTESEDEAAVTNKCMTYSFSKVDSTDKATGAITLEKKRLEEHISRLISHNKAVVDDTQLDSVRPRKTILSKQGSIDLPMPYMYKDSFHFDIRPLDTSKKKNISLRSAKSIFTPAEKTKPLFFHSVPTQFSTTIDCVPVTRSNSLPFVESTKKTQDQADSSKLSSFSRVSPDVCFSGLLHSSNLDTNMTNVLNSHPRALVRQVAVDDVPLNYMTESSLSLEEKNGKQKSEAGVEGVNSKNKKPSQRKLKMFSQEKWQVYGDETFKKIYQKVKNSQPTKKQKGNLTNISNIYSDTKETACGKEITLSREGRSSETGNIISPLVDVTAKANPDTLESHAKASPAGHSTFSQENSGRLAELRETLGSVGDCEQHSIANETSSVEHRCRDLRVSKHSQSGNSKALPLRKGCELKVQLKQTQLNPATWHDHDLEDAHGHITECVQKYEDTTANRKGCRGKETAHLGHTALSAPQCNTSELVCESQKLPSERKKPKVDKLKNVEKITFKNSSSTELVVKLIDCYNLNIVAAESAKDSGKGGKWTVMVGTPASGSSMECEEGIQHSLTVSNDRDCIVSLTDTANISATSFPEQFKTDVTEEQTSNLFAIKNLTSPITTATEELSNCRDSAPTHTQHEVRNQVVSHLKKNDFLPKYILKYSQEGNKIGVPLFLTREPENIPYASLPSSSTISPYPACNNKLLDSNSIDVTVCPLQLDLSHPARRKELKWDMPTTWTPLGAPAPTLLEATTITTMVDQKCHLRSASRKVKDTCKADNRDNLDEQRLITKEDECIVACTSHIPGRKVCFTTIYTGGLFLSSDMTGQNSALKLIQSAKSSVISLSSLVERAVLCESSEKEVKEWQLETNPLPGFEDLPTCSVSSPKCLCHSSNMLYCHVLCTQPKEICSQPQLSIESHAGNLQIPSLNLSFPTLNAEPQLTWCCLSRSLPLPIEQKEMKDSAYSSLYMNENFISKCGQSICKMKSHGKAAREGWRIGKPQTLFSSPQRQEIEKKYILNTDAQEVSKSMPELERKKEKLYKRREKRNLKRIKVKINPKRHEDHHSQRHRLLRSHQSSKQCWGLRTSRKHSHINASDIWEHCGKCHCFPTTSLGNDKNLQQPHYSTTNKASFHLEEDKMKQDTPGLNKCSSDNLFLQRISTIPEVTTYSCPSSNNISAEKCSSLDSCSLGIFPKEHHPDVDSEYNGPSTEPYHLELKDTKKNQLCNFVGSQTTRPIFLCSNRGCNNLESKDKNVLILKPPIPIAERTEQFTERNLSSPLKEQHASTCQSLCPVSLTSRLLTEMSVSTKSLPGTPSNQKQNLEATNKPIHLEYDDISSSDDEDRLVIEI